MRTIIEASLVLGIAILLTIVIMAVIFPSHARNGSQQVSESTNIWPAVFVEGTHERPGTAGSPADPKSADTGATTACPYLTALVAASKCPVAPESATPPECPYMKQLQRQFREATTKSRAASGQHI